MSDVIVLLKDFAFVGANGQSWSTDWIQFPAGHIIAQLVVVVKSRIGSSSIVIQLETSWDTDDTTNAGSSVTTGAPGTSIVNITSNLGPMVRLTLTAAADSQLNFSVYLTPKSE